MLLSTFNFFSMQNRKFYASVGFFLLLSQMILAQKATLKGRLLDNVTAEPLIGATVQVNELGAATDEDGNFIFTVPAGKIKILFRFIGYQPQEETILVENGKIYTFDKKMSQELTFLQTTTITSGKFERPLGEATVSIDVIKPNLIENGNVTTMDKVLDKVPGLNMIDGQANIRGGSGYSYGAGSRVLLLVDDIPALQADAGFPNWSDLPVENVEQIEVVKGAASALYGSAAMNGIINIRTGYAKSEPVTKVSTFYNIFEKPQEQSRVWWGNKTPATAGLSAFHSQKFGKLDLVLGGFYQSENSYLKDTYSRYGRLNGSLRYRITDRLSVGISANFNKGESGYFFYWLGEGREYEGTPSTIAVGKRSRTYIDPFVNYFDKFGNRHKILSRFYRVDNTTSGEKSNASDLIYGEYQFQRNFEKYDMVATAGLVYTGTSVQSPLYGDSLFSSQNIAGYLQIEKKLFNRFTISAGVRYEKNSLFSPQKIGKDSIPDGKTIEAKPVGRIGLNYQAAKYTFLRASYGQGYRFPTIAEKFISTSVGALRIAPNPKLISETGWSAEFGVKQGIKLGNWAGFADFALFQSEYKNMMEFVLENFFSGFQSKNVGNTVIRGAEVSLAGQGNLFGLPTQILMGYTYIDPKFKNYEALTDAEKSRSSADYNILKYRYKHIIKFDAQTRYRAISGGIGTIYNSNMEAIDRVFYIIPGVEKFRSVHTKGYMTLEARIATHFWKDKIQVSIIGKNLTNAVYMPRPGILEAPRNWTLRLDWRF